MAEAAPAPDLHTYASTTAQEYGLDPVLFSRVISCESDWNPLATSPTADYGIEQIHAAAHPELTMDEMLDPYFSIRWAAQEWQKGNAGWWTCYRKLR